MNTNKMQWFIDAYNNNTLEYTIAKTGANFGHVIMPTGTGKSGKVYEDMCRIIDAHKTGQKLVINISCPILKLTQQFINDFFAAAKEIYKDSKTFAFFINSSDNGTKYNDALQCMDVDVEYFKNFDKKFVNNPYADIAIVASCHKSLYKFINKIAKITLPMEIVTYIDEAHLVDIREHNEDEDSEIVCINLDKLCKYSSKVYALTATPDPEVVEKLNDYNLTLTGTGKYIYQMKPIEAISENIILPPYVNCISTKLEGIDVKLLMAIMRDAKAFNPHMAHKILVTLKSSAQLKSLRKELESLKYKVFSTCSQFGYSDGNSEDEDDEYNDVTEFIRDIDTYNGDCFVLHIKQLIQGIDIKSLTDCVIWTNSASQRHYRHTIQVIGRTLRPLTGERGMDKESRIKKIGGVYFISNNENTDNQLTLSNFICRYYGFDNVTFAAKSYGVAGTSTDDLFTKFKDESYNNGWDNPQIKELLINIENYIKTKVVPMIKLYKNLGKKLDISKIANDVLLQHDAIGKEWNTSELLDKRDLFDKISDIFVKYGVNDCITLF